MEKKHMGKILTSFNNRMIWIILLFIDALMMLLCGRRKTKSTVATATRSRKTG